jgi:hypothetical protein
MINLRRLTNAKGFGGASSFNLDLSEWCVSNFSSEPSGFATDSSLTNPNKPAWGTCPD